MGWHAAHAVNQIYLPSNSPEIRTTQHQHLPALWRTSLGVLTSLAVVCKFHEGSDLTSLAFPGHDSTRAAALPDVSYLNSSEIFVVLDTILALTPSRHSR